MKVMKLFFNLDEEEAWLNQMLADGFKLNDKVFNYNFTKASDDEKGRILRLDYRLFPNKTAYIEYRQLMADCGWNHLVGTKSSGKHYFIQAESNMDSEIFSTEESKQLRYLPLFKTCLFTFITLSLLLWSVFQSQNFSILNILNPKAYYFTPGLWEMQSTQFIGAFLFETPFALTRGYMWLIVLGMTLMYAVQAYYAHSQMKRTFLGGKKHNG